MSTIPERVALGEAFMDEADPKWWRADTERAIDLDRLDLADSGLCVLGQRCPLEVAAAYRACWPDTNWDDEIDAAYSACALWLTERDPGGFEGDDLARWGDEHGFSASYDAADYPKLTAEWVRVIRSRRSRE